MTSPPSTTDRPPAGKAVLYCLECDHESPVDGDWEIRRRGGRDCYRCPNCGTTITARPRSSTPRASGLEDGRCSCPGD